MRKDVSFIMCADFICLRYLLNMYLEAGTLFISWLAVHVIGYLYAIRPIILSAMYMHFFRLNHQQYDITVAFSLFNLCPKQRSLMQGRSFLEFPFKIWCKTMLIPDYGSPASDVCVNSLLFT